MVVPYQYMMIVWAVMFGYLVFGDVPSLAPRHRAIVDAATGAVRARLDYAPLAFGLQPPMFTLSVCTAWILPST